MADGKKTPDSPAAQEDQPFAPRSWACCATIRAGPSGCRPDPADHWRALLHHARRRPAPGSPSGIADHRPYAATCCDQPNHQNRRANQQRLRRSHRRSGQRRRQVPDRQPGVRRPAAAAVVMARVLSAVRCPVPARRVRWRMTACQAVHRGLRVVLDGWDQSQQRHKRMAFCAILSLSIRKRELTHEWLP
jgi:hypothetical protein